MPRFLETLLLAACLGFAVAGSATAEDKGAVKPYTLPKCVVNGDDIDADATVIVYKGQEVKLCCKKCIKKFNADPDKWLAEIQKQEQAEAAKKK
jgi:hypothetical protein